jgi:hypothetical protein
MQQLQPGLSNGRAQLRQEFCRQTRIGWEAGTRTPIRRSRVLQPRFQRRKISNLARQNNNNSGKIRNTPAIKIVKVSTAMKTQRISRSNANKIVRHCVRAMPLPFSDPSV